MGGVRFNPPPACHVQLSTKKPIKLGINCAIVATTRVAIRRRFQALLFFRKASILRVGRRVFCVRRGFPFLLWPLGENCLHCILRWCMRIEKYLQFSKIHPEAGPDWSLSCATACRLPHFAISILYSYLYLAFLQSYLDSAFNTPKCVRNDGN